MSKGRVSWKTFMKSELTSVLFLLHVLLVTLIVEGRIEILSWPIKQVAGDCETGSDSKINLANWKVVSGKKMQQFNKDKCKLHAGRNASVNTEWGTTEWVNGVMVFYILPRCDLLMTLNHGKVNHIQRGDYSRVEKEEFDISHYTSIGLKACNSKTKMMLTLQLDCRWIQFHHWHPSTAGNAKTVRHI